MMERKMIYLDDAIVALERDILDPPVLHDAIATIRELPSAQPEITETQVKEYCEKRCLVVLDSEFFHRLLSAQPEIIRCKDCKHWDTAWTPDWSHDHHYCPMIDVVCEGDFYCADADMKG